MFTGDIALVLEISLIASGLFILGKIGEKSTLTKITSYFLIIAGLAMASCTFYRQLKFHFTGPHHGFKSRYHDKNCPYGKRGKLKSKFRSRKEALSSGRKMPKNIKKGGGVLEKYKNKPDASE